MKEKKPTKDRYDGSFHAGGLEGALRGLVKDDPGLNGDRPKLLAVVIAVLMRTFKAPRSVKTKGICGRCFMRAFVEAGLTQIQEALAYLEAKGFLDVRIHPGKAFEAFPKDTTRKKGGK